MKAGYDAEKALNKWPKQYPSMNVAVSRGVGRFTLQMTALSTPHKFRQEVSSSPPTGTLGRLQSGTAAPCTNYVVCTHRWHHRRSQVPEKGRLNVTHRWQRRRSQVPEKGRLNVTLFSRYICAIQSLNY